MSETTLPRRAWSPSEVADMFGISGDKVRRLIRDGELAARKVGRSWLVSDTEVQRYLHET